MGERRNVYEVLFRYPEGTTLWRDLRVDVRIMSRKQSVGMWIGFILLKIETCDWLL
jgi:hypothetical protein